MRHDDPVEVRRGETEDPDQFLWRGRLWKVRAVLAHWTETGPERADATGGGRGAVATLVRERELWRVEAGLGMAGRPQPVEQQSSDVFDLSYDPSDRRWRLVGCAERGERP